MLGSDHVFIHKSAFVWSTLAFRVSLVPALPWVVPPASAGRGRGAFC